SDILALAASFLRSACERAERPLVTISPQVAERLVGYEWPGNVRELENCMERVAALARYETARLADLPEHLRPVPVSQFGVGEAANEEIVTIDELERRHILKVLERFNGNKSRTAEVVGLDRRTLYRKLETYQRAGKLAAASKPVSSAEAAALSA
ncbi:MAG TPA: helix-turn-helix domain-containing protein, partial [Polyangiales bacterium]|nr:helix-turn-helix domain-containing protein [Polyangiales bacterium]